MTEEEWLATNAGLMLHHIEQRHSPTPRKMRLLAVAYARFLETQSEYADAKHVAHLGEEVADSFQTLEELWDDRVRGWGYAGSWAIANLVLASDRIGNKIRMHICGVMKSETDPTTNEMYAQRHCDALRPHILCIFGNPFRPVSFSAEWRTDTALSLAKQMYDSREFSAAGILADALQDAGCDGTQLLEHLRDPHATHVRGCWALDLVLGKA